MDLQARSKKIFGFAIVISVFIHLGIFLTSYIIPSPNKNSNSIEVQLIEKEISELKSEDSLKQIVDQSDKSINDELDPNAKLLSKNNQKVQKQTIAKERGEFQNRKEKSDLSGLNSRPKKFDFNNFKPKFDIQKAVEEKLKQELSNDSLNIASKEKTKKEESSNEAQEQEELSGADISKSFDYIKDLDPGLETLLTTREFIYYSYYSRIRQQLSQIWSSKIQEKVRSIYQQGRQIASTTDKITKCLVTLDGQGKIVRVQVIGNSGIYEIDAAAVESFYLAAPFPNPPRGMIEGDGKIRIRWDFVLEG